MPLFSSSDTQARLKAAQANPVDGTTPSADRTRTALSVRSGQPRALPRQAPTTPAPTSAATATLTPGPTGLGGSPSTLPNTFATRAALRLKAAHDLNAQSTVAAPPPPKSALEEASDAIAKARKAAERRRRQAVGVAAGLKSRRMDGVPQANAAPRTLIGSGY